MVTEVQDVAVELSVAMRCVDVKRIYKDILDERKYRNRERIKIIQQKGREHFEKVASVRFNYPDITPIEFFKQDVTREQKTKGETGSKIKVPMAVIYRWDTGEKERFKKQQRVAIHTIEDDSAVPPMMAWASMQQNMVVPDELVMPNLPYLGDQTDPNVLEELVGAYDQGVHGFRECRFINDNILYELTRRVYNAWKANEFALSGNLKVNVEALGAELPDEVFQAILEKFPDLCSGSLFELKERYAEIYNGKHRGTASTAKPLHVGNLDGADATSEPVSVIMDSTNCLFCRRCLRFSCQLNHQFYATPIQSKAHWPAPNLPSPSKRTPCCENCYLHAGSKRCSPMKQQTQSFTKLRGRRCSNHVELIEENPPILKKRDSQHSSDVASNSSVDDANFTISQWTPGEESLFRALSIVYGTNYCELARRLRTKTCVQVHAFAHTDPPHMRQLAASGALNEVSVAPQSSKRSRKAKSKKTTRIYSNMVAIKQAEINAGVGRITYQPCNHSGPCGIADGCECAKRNTFCEKFCLCSPSCPKRFPGCRCKAQCKTKACPCFVANRECDPDLCMGACGAHIFDRPISCMNVGIQRKQTKHLLLSQSRIAGWGIFSLNALKKDELVSEYVGELITHNECERRGRLYDTRGCTYLFTLTTDLVCDATRKGNKIRFANHSKRYANCYPKVMLVNGDYRIGIYTKRAIEPLEELLFDYSFADCQRLDFVSIERPPEGTPPPGVKRSRPSMRASSEEEDADE